MDIKLTLDGLRYLQGFCLHPDSDINKDLKAEPHPEYPQELTKVTGFNCSERHHALLPRFYTVVRKHDSTLPRN